MKYAINTEFINGASIARIFSRNSDAVILDYVDKDTLKYMYEYAFADAPVMDVSAEQLITALKEYASQVVGTVSNDNSKTISDSMMSDQESFRENVWDSMPSYMNPPIL